jgi:DNA repair protein RadC
VHYKLIYYPRENAMDTETSPRNAQHEPRNSAKKPHKGQGHRQRLRERFLSAGLDGFQDYEIIELLLTLGTPRKDCKDAAKASLHRFKTLQGVLEAADKELYEVEGIGPKNSFGIKLIKAVADRYLKKKLIGKDPINNSKELFAYLYHNIRDKNREYFKAVYLDSKNRVISTETLSEGTLTASSVYPREVVHAALSHHAAALIFAHNHPSGDPKPSQDDISITRQLVFAGRVMGITVHEHIIIGDNRYFSFGDQGYITRMNREYDALVTRNPEPLA